MISLSLLRAVRLYPRKDEKCTCRHRGTLITRVPDRSSRDGREKWAAAKEQPRTKTAATKVFASSLVGLLVRLAGSGRGQGAVNVVNRRCPVPSLRRQRTRQSQLRPG